MKTPWFDKYTRPHWIGVYQTRIDGSDRGLFFNYWNGERWSMCACSKKGALVVRNIPTCIQHIEWRGFTKEQK
jgi:hypothetical protein